MRRALTSIAALVAALLLAGAAAPVAGAADGWRITWADEFAGLMGTPPDRGRWVHNDHSGPGEWERYTARPENASLDGLGHLALTARRESLPGMPFCAVGSCDITSGKITTQGRFAQAYGRFEARVLVPAGRALWPAFWMLGDRDWPDGGEIDVMEVLGQYVHTTYASIHGPGFALPGIGWGGQQPDGSPITGAFHTYGVDWAPGSITWRLDGRPYLTVRRSDLAAGQAWVFDHPMFLLLDMAVGGDWPGPPDATTPLPATTLVDWVRVWERAGA